MVIALLASLAHAATVDLGVATDFPLWAGGRATVEGPARLRLTLGLGAMPTPYLALVDDVCVAASCYPRVVADLIEATLSRSLVAREHVGWRPWTDRGFELEVGHQVATLGGSLSTAELVDAATGLQVPDDPPAARALDAHATVQFVDVDVGWEWVVWRPITHPHGGLVLRADLGGSFTVHARSTLAPRWPSQHPALLQAWTTAAEGLLDGEIEGYVHAPTLGVGVAWRLGASGPDRRAP